MTDTNDTAAFRRRAHAHLLFAQENFNEAAAALEAALGPVVNATGAGFTLGTWAPEAATTGGYTPQTIDRISDNCWLITFTDGVTIGAFLEEQLLCFADGHFEHTSATRPSRATTNGNWVPGPATATGVAGSTMDGHLLWIHGGAGSTGDERVGLDVGIHKTDLAGTDEANTGPVNRLIAAMRALAGQPDAHDIWDRWIQAQALIDLNDAREVLEAERDIVADAQALYDTTMGLTDPD